MARPTRTAAPAIRARAPPRIHLRRIDMGGSSGNHMQDIPRTPCGASRFLVGAGAQRGYKGRTMETRRLGRSGIEVSALGMGCWAIGGPWTMTQPGEKPYAAGWGQTDDRVSIRAVHAALDAGVALFDTAASYGAGHSEHVLGQALRGRRDQAVIATKFGHLVNEADH